MRDPTKRPSWHQHWMTTAKGAAEMSTCVRRAVGAVVVLGKDQLCTGFNGPPDRAPMRTDECGENPCVRIGIPSGERADVVCCAHAEQNAISTAARRGIRLEGATLYTTVKPCAWCARAIIRAGIVCVVYDDDYADPLTTQVFEQSRVSLIRLADML